jgi:hypothetical protein
LEVTWSLIQQRQQEEEEAAAAELLEEMNTKGDSEDDKEEEASDVEGDGTQMDEPKPVVTKKAKKSADSNHSSLKKVVVEEPNLSESEESGESDDENSLTASHDADGGNDVNDVNSKSSSKEESPVKDASKGEDVSSVPLSSDTESLEIRSAVLRGELEVTSSSEEEVDDSDDDDDDNNNNEISPKQAPSEGSLSDDESHLSSVRSAVLRGELEVTSSSSEDEDVAHDDHTPSKPTKKKTSRGVVMDSLAMTANSPHEAKDTPKWQCNKCTVLNDYAVRQCTVCDAAMPRSIRRSLSQSSSL